MSREADLYKDKIEVSLDGRQIFYLFFGGAVIVGLVFVLGVMVGRRVEARGHVDRARTTAAVDPLAALDRLEGNTNLSFKASLMGTPASSDVENEIADLEKARAGKKDAKPEHGAKPAVAVAEPKPEAKPEAKPEPAKVADAKPDAKPVTKPEPAKVADAKPVAKLEPKSEHKGDVNADAKTEPVTKPEPAIAKVEPAKPEPKKPEAKKADEAKKLDEAKKPDAVADGKAVDKAKKPDAVADAKAVDKAKKPDAVADAKVVDKKKPEAGPTEDKPKTEDAPKAKYTLQLSSFQDKAEADAFLSALKAQGYQAHVTEATVSGKTFYRVRMGSYKSLEAANDAKAELEKSAKKSASVMKL